MARPLVAGNWKMNTTVDEAVALAEALKPGLSAVDGIDRAICPPFISLVPVAGVLEGSGIDVGAQDAHPEQSGAFTGAVSVSMLAELCDFVIVGHSERRAMFGETDEIVSVKANAVVAAGMRPIVCVGESLEVRETGDAEQFVTGQLEASLAGVSRPEAVVVAYEPIWAIGTGRSARPDAVQEMAAALRRTLAGSYGDEAAARIPVLYGGSVNSENVGPFVDRPDIDGALVGGASLDADEFVRIAELIALIRVG